MDERAARVDSWLWAIRMYKTRSVASTACKGGHVEVNGRTAKPATRVVAGDRVTARVGSLVRELEVVAPVEKRVGAAIAVTCYIDLAPPPPPSAGAPTRDAVRERGAGRPTKRDRRQIDRLRGRD
ncbi:MAG: S4 domain-containing protein [Actinomycetota bacterium]|nr:S4 domain-containing protein [Actinomycetota bacterium]